MMSQESMPERKHTHQKSKGNHARLKPEIMYDIDPEYGQSG